MSDESVDTNAQLFRALTSLKEMRLRLEAVDAARTEPIAIIGMGCRLPGAANPDELWELVRSGGDAITETPAERWDVESLYDRAPDTAGKVATRWGGFLDGIDSFDAGFFGISPREAAQMDPQQRLLLEVAWEALEDGGQSVDRLAGSDTGAFVGVHSHSDDYFTMQSAEPLGLDLFSGTGTSHSVLSGRLSYLFDLRGPSLAIDTACSSSLVAVHLAVKSLRSGEISLAIAGGVNAIIDPTFTMVASRMRMMSATGRCRPFDAGADGFVRAEGCAVVVLKRLSDAQRDGDRVLAVIAGSAVNQDGRSNGLTAPNSLSQQAVIRAALADAGMTAAQIGLVEAHGTGTPLGDPIEIEALTAVFNHTAVPDDGRAPAVALGSVKANIGHAEGAAGVAALIKTVLVLRAGVIPPLVHFHALNPHISLAGTPFSIPREATPWRAGREARAAGVSSFGWSGTNAHLVVREAPPPAAVTAAGPVSGPVVLTISARSEAALRQLVAAHREMLDGASRQQLHAICVAAGQRTHHREHRVAVAGRTAADLIERLDAYLIGDDRRELASGSARHDATVFVYSGQGGQWPGMARGLIAENLAFRAQLERCDAAMEPHLGWSLVDRLTSDEDPARLDDVDVVQPLLFAIQVAATAMLGALGVTPDAVVGHSMGEVAAAHVAGILTLEDAALVICRRSALLRRIAGRGTMVAVGLDEAGAIACIAGAEDRVAVAVLNGASSTVLSGDVAALAAVTAKLEADGVFCRPVRVDVASHSPQVDELLGELRDDLAGIRPREGVVPLMSAVTAGFEDGTRLDASYWAQNMREPVRFADAVSSLLSAGHGRFVEISPHPVLLGPVGAAGSDIGRAVTAIPTMMREADEPVLVAAALGALHVDGVSISWDRAHPSDATHVDLPAYPWQRERHWLDHPSGASQAIRGRGPRDDALLGWSVPIAVEDGLRVWERAVDRRDEPTWFDHRIGGVPSLPASALVALLSRAAALAGLGSDLSDVRFERLALLDDAWPTSFQVVVETGRSARPSVSVASRHDAPQHDAHQAEVRWQRHATATIGAPAWAGSGGGVPPADRTGLSVDAANARYRELAADGVELGPALRSIVAARKSDRHAVVEVSGEHPVNGSLVAVDALMQAAVLAAGEPGGPLHMPASIDVVRLPGAPTARMLGLVTTRTDGEGNAPAGGSEPIIDGVLVDESDRPVAMIEGLRLQRLDRAAERLEDWLYRVDWHALQAEESEVTIDSDREWLLIGDTGGFAVSVERTLRDLGARCTRVPLPDGPVGTEAVRVATTAALEATQDRVVGIVFLGGLEDDAPVDSDALVDRQRAGAAALLGIVKACATKDARITVVTRGAQHVTDGDTTGGFAHAPLWGLSRAIDEELPDLSGGAIDLDPRVDLDASAAALAAELTIREAAPDEPAVALRANQRWVARLSRMPLAERRPERLRADATYLVTGGFGAVGAHVARRLVERGAHRLALVARTPLPARHTWRDEPADSPIGRRIALIRELEQLGAAVHVLTVDVGDAAALRAVLHEFIGEGWPAIRGVHHTAAVFGGQFMTDLTEPELIAQLRPKLVGAWTLADELPELDHLVLYSSIAALLPMAGQGAYAAGNAFLDVFAAHRRDLGKPALSVEWAFWEGSSDGESNTREIAGYKDAARTLAEARGMHGFLPTLGLDALDRLLAHDVTSAAVLPIDWRAWAGARNTRPLALVADVVATATDTGAPNAAIPPSTLTERLASAPAEERADIADAAVRRLVSEVLRLAESRIGDDQPFGTLGLDSLMAIELRNRLEAETGLSLSATLAWNYPTVRDLRTHVLTRVCGGSGCSDDADAVPVGTSVSAEVRAAGNVGDVGEVAAAVARLSDEDALVTLLGEGT